MLSAISTTLTLLSLLGNEADLEPTVCNTSAGSPETVAVRPIRRDFRTANAILELGFATVPEHRSLAISSAGKRMVAKDDGVYPDRIAGDGVFAVATTLKEKPSTTRQASFIDGEGDVVLFKWKIKFKITACPPDCESLLGGSCWFCIGVAEVEVGS